MSDFLEIGEIVEAIPNSVKIVTPPTITKTVITEVPTVKTATPKVAVPKNINPEVHSTTPNLSETSKSGSNRLGWWLLCGAVIAGGAFIYFKLKQDENTDISNKP
jgi:uncharacterized protein HemX